MEIKSDMTWCPNGHCYNAALHDSCPICAGAGAFPSTQPPGEVSGLSGGEAGFPSTQPLGPAGGSSVTIPVEGGGGVSPFERPTIIGGEMGGVTEPVVGWLVCVDGPMRGNDYRIHAGYNYIGRETGDIRIRGDQQISRQNHAMIAYDSSDRIFYVGPSAGRNLIKVNGKTVLNAVEIHDHDILSIGTTKLIFVPLCGESFAWEGAGEDA